MTGASDLSQGSNAARFGRKRIARLAQTRLGLAKPRVRLHPRHGRNRLFLVSDEPGGNFLVKQDNLAGACSRECLAYELIGGATTVISPVLLLPRLHLAIFRFDPLALTLEDLAITRPLRALALLADLAERSSCFLDIRLPPHLPVGRRTLSVPYPLVHEVLDLSPAAHAFLLEAQARDLLRRCAPRGRHQLGFAHGDLKLDNILVTEGAARLIDFEACCAAPTSSHPAGFAALMLLTMIRARSSPDASVRGQADFRPALACAEAALVAFSGHMVRRGWPGPDRGETDKAVARALMELAFNQCLHKQRISAADHLMIELASSILDHGLSDLAHASA